MLFHYKAVANSGEEREGEIDALNNDLAIGSLQKRGLVVVSISAVGAKKSFSNISFFQRVTLRDTVVLSRQIAALFEAQVPVLKAFQMLSADTENLLLRQKLTAVTDDVQAGLSISSAMAKHPTPFLISMSTWCGPEKNLENFLKHSSSFLITLIATMN